MSKKVAIIASGGANIASLQFALERLNASSFLASHPAQIAGASHVILPGVGAAGDAMQRLKEGGFVDLIRSLESPLLGICLGMQLLFESSAEDDAECLGLIPGRAEKLQAAPGVPVPHMGWNTVEFEPDAPLMDGLTSNQDFAYFVHSYAAANGQWTTARCTHGAEFSACVRRDNFFGVQFHPERSGKNGARLLQNFLAVSCV